MRAGADSSGYRQRNRDGVSDTGEKGKIVDVPSFMQKREIFFYNRLC
jgi:hypothetical protein